MKMNKKRNNKNEPLFEIIKLLSAFPLFLTIYLEIEFLIILIINSFTQNILLTIILFISFHYLLLHFGIESFLYFMQFPLIGKSSFHSNGCSQANNLIIALSIFIDICEKIIDHEKISLSEEYSNVLDVYEGVNMLIYLYYEMKKKYGLSTYQKKLYDSLIIWRKHFKRYKILQYFQENKKYMGEYTNIMFNKKLIQLIMDSNFIIKISEDFTCRKYQILSFKKIYNFIFNDTFYSMNQCKVVFNMKFKEKPNKFITSDNKIIDFTIIDSNNIIKHITKKIPFQNIIKNKSRKKEEHNENNNKKEDEESEGTQNLMNTTISNQSISSNKMNYNENKKKNLVIFCNPNSMIYEFISPERYFFYYEGGCDILFWNYRGYGLSEGHCTFSNNRKDILELFDEIKKLNKWEKYGVHGYSIGGVSATYLAKERNIDLLVSDRNFSHISRIVESYTLGKLIKYIYKLVILDGINNEKNYLYTKNIRCCKIILCDPMDEVVTNNGSLKTSISNYIIRNCLQNKKSENVLEIFFDRKERNKFVDSLMNIMKFFNKNCLSKNNIFIEYLNKFFDCFKYGSEDLANFRNISYSRLKVLYINNFFNNFFIWGAKTFKDDENNNSNDNVNENENENDCDMHLLKTENIPFYLEKSIEILNKMLKMEKYMLSLNENNNVLNYIHIIKNGLIKMKDNLEMININENISKGYLIRLNCGHNNTFSGIQENTLVEIMERFNFLK